MTSAQPVALIIVEEMWRMQWKRETIWTLNQKRCHSETIEEPLVEKCFKEIIHFGLIYPPSGSLCSNINKAMLILLAGTQDQ